MYKPEQFIIDGIVADNEFNFIEDLMQYTLSRLLLSENLLQLYPVGVPLKGVLTKQFDLGKAFADNRQTVS